jgi:hypothetical protein
MFEAPFFAEAQLVDVIRYAGYPTYSYFGWVFEQDYATLTLRLQNMSQDESNVIINNYLVQLPLMEAAIDGSSANLDTDVAAVWTHNKDEVQDRTMLYNQKRRQLCAYIGVRPGPGLRGGGSVIRT